MGKQEPLNRYAQIIERIFLSLYRKGAHEVTFERQEIERVAREQNVKVLNPLNTFEEAQ